MLRKLILASAFALAACSVQLTGVTPAVTPLPPAYPVATLASATAEALTGRLLYTLTQQGVWQLDLATGDSTQLFKTETQDSWAASAAASPDGSTILIAYAPPPPEGEIQFGYTDLYRLVPEGAPQPFLERPDPRESLFTPTWSPDGRYVYYSRLRRIPNAGDQPQLYDIRYDIERVAYPSGQPETVVVNAFWPRLSDDGQRMVYVSVDPQTFANGLFVAEADGGNAIQLLTSEQFVAIDSPLFSPDDQYVLFSAVSTGGAATPRPLALFDWLTGVRVAEAHNVPSDWWRIPVGGGTAERLTRVFDVGLYGDFSPDGQHMAFISATGISVMRPDGGELRILLPLTNAAGTLEWLP